VKAIEAAACKDQLNLPSLHCVEILLRRAQLIESAHAINPSNPDYSNAEVFMGWGVQRGGALVAPQLSKHAAQKVGERATFMKEQRRYMEEMRLKKPTNRPSPPNANPKAKGKKGKQDKGDDDE
jgi:hypothetical protein